MTLASIQDKLDAIEPGGNLPVEIGDYDPCVINKPVTILGDGATFWTDGSTPALIINSPNVTIKNANFRCLKKTDSVVLSVAPEYLPVFQNVRIQGIAEGVESVPGKWLMPPSINTGAISPTNSGFFLDFGVPQRCQIVCRVAGVSMDPGALTPGVNTVKLQIRDAMADSILVGEIEVSGNVITRIIPFFARITTSGNTQDSSSVPYLYQITPQEKDLYEKVLSGRSAEKSPVRKEQVNSQPDSAKIPDPTNEKTVPDTTVSPAHIPSTSESQPPWAPIKRKNPAASAPNEQKLGAAFATSDHEGTDSIQNLPDPKVTGELGNAFSPGQEQKPMSEKRSALPTAPSLKSTVLGTLFSGITEPELPPSLEGEASETQDADPPVEEHPEKTTPKSALLSNLFTGQ